MKGQEKTCVGTFCLQRLLETHTLVLRDRNRYSEFDVNKTLLERLALRASKKSALTSSSNRVNFLVHRHEIEEALLAGWSVKSIWEMLNEEGKIAFSYKTFRRYIAQLIRAENTPNKDKPVTTPVKTSAQPSAIPGFTFNAVPNLKELI